jgi:predicted S18 family serine protease
LAKISKGEMSIRNAKEYLNNAKAVSKEAYDDACEEVNMALIDEEIVNEERGIETAVYR